MSKKLLIIIIVVILFSSCNVTTDVSQKTEVIANTTVPIETLPVTEVPILITPTPNADITIRTAPSYIPIDEEILGVKINMNIILVDELPWEYTEDDVVDDVIGLHLIKRYYEFGWILLLQEHNESKEESIVAIVEITEQGYLGPCNVEVGDTQEEVLSKLGITEDYIKNKQQQIYDGSGNGSVGLIWYEQESTEIVYINLYYKIEEIRGALYFEFENGELALFGIRKPVY